MSAESLLENFYAQTLEATELNTEYLLCPEIEEVPVTVKDYDFRMGLYEVKRGPNIGQERPWANLQLRYEVDSAEAREFIKKDEVLVYGKPIFLNLDENLILDPENNQALARLLKLFEIDIAGLDIKGIFDSFTGHYAIGKITHRALTQKDGSPLLDDEGEQKYAAEVSALGKA